MDPLEKDEQEQQSAEMEAALGALGAPSEEPPTQEVPTDNPPVETPPVDTPPVETPPPSEEPPKEEPPKEPAPTEPPQQTEAERLAAENARLREELNAQARQYGQKPPEPPKEAVPPETPTPTPAPAAPIEFLTAEEAALLLDNPQDVLNAVLNKVFQAGREQVMREMPALVRQQTVTEITTQQRVQKFWSENKDLEPYRDFCAMTAQQIEIENPGLAFHEVLEKTAERARERLNLTKPAVEEEVPVPPEPSKKPALPGSPGAARKPVPVATSGNVEEQEMIDILT